MKKAMHDVKVYAKHVEKRDGFDVYLDFSGQEEYLMHHRRNHDLWALLADRPYLSDLQRKISNRKVFYKVDSDFHNGENYGRKGNRRNRNQKLDKMLSHLFMVIDDYLDEKYGFMEEQYLGNFICKCPDGRTGEAPR